MILPSGWRTIWAPSSGEPVPTAVRTQPPPEPKAGSGIPVERSRTRTTLAAVPGWMPATRILPSGWTIGRVTATRLSRPGMETTAMPSPSKRRVERAAAAGRRRGRLDARHHEPDRHQAEHQTRRRCGGRGPRPPSANPRPAALSPDPARSPSSFSCFVSRAKATPPNRPSARTQLSLLRPSMVSGCCGSVASAFVRLATSCAPTWTGVTQFQAFVRQVTGRMCHSARSHPASDVRSVRSARTLRTCDGVRRDRRWRDRGATPRRWWPPPAAPSP